MKKIIPIVLLLVCVFSGVSRAETAPAKQTTIETDKYGRDTPRGSLEGFLKAAAAKDYSLAARFLDLRFVSEEEALTEGPQLAQKLQLILIRSLKTQPDKVSPDYQASCEWTACRMPSSRTPAPLPAPLMTKRAFGSDEFLRTLEEKFKISISRRARGRPKKEIIQTIEK
jgi:hypothetical protein